jgi:integrase
MAGKGTKRQTRGAGAIRQLPSGRYQAKVKHEGTYYSADQTFDTRLAAQTWLADRNREIAAGTFEPPEKASGAMRNPTFGAYAPVWLKERGLKPRTVEEYQRLLDDHLIPAWGAKRLDTITVRSVKTWYATLDPSTPTTRARTYGLLRAILQTAYQDDLIETNPCRVRGGGQAKRATRTVIPTAEQVQALANGMPSTKYKTMVLLAAWCGLRFGELTELRRRDLVIEGGLPVALIVERAVVRVEGRYEVGTPKSDAGVRDVVIPPHIRADVAAYLSSLPKRADVLLFPGSRNGAHMAPSSLYKPFYRVRKAVGLPTLRWHDLRHFSGTVAAQSGATLAEVMGRLGHSTTQAAMRYQHAAQDRDAAIAEAMSAKVIPLRPAQAEGA